MFKCYFRFWEVVKRCLCALTLHSSPACCIWQTNTLENMSTCTQVKYLNSHWTSSLCTCEYCFFCKERWPSGLQVFDIVFWLFSPPFWMFYNTLFGLEVQHKWLRQWNYGTDSWFINRMHPFLQNPLCFLSAGQWCQRSRGSPGSAAVKASGTKPHWRGLGGRERRGVETQLSASQCHYCLLATVLRPCSLSSHRLAWTGLPSSVCLRASGQTQHPVWTS